VSPVLSMALDVVIGITGLRYPTSVTIVDGASLLERTRMTLVDLVEVEAAVSRRSWQ
jgi:hypothetical protein